MKRYKFLGKVFPDFPKRVDYPAAPSSNSAKHR